MHRRKLPLRPPFCAHGPCGIPARAKECAARRPTHNQRGGAAELHSASTRARQGLLQRLARDRRGQATGRAFASASARGNNVRNLCNGDLWLSARRTNGLRTQLIKPDLSSNGCRGTLHRTLIWCEGCVVCAPNLQESPTASLGCRVANEAVVDDYYREGAIVRIIVGARRPRPTHWLFIFNLESASERFGVGLEGLHSDASI